MRFSLDVVRTLIVFALMCYIAGTLAQILAVYLGYTN